MLIRYEIILCRFTRASRGGPGSGTVTLGTRHDFSGEPRQSQTLACCTTGRRRSWATDSDWRSQATYHTRAGRGSARPSYVLSRRNSGRAYPALECRPEHVTQPFDGGSRHSAPPVDPKKKSLIASERDQWDRTHFAVQQLDVDPHDIVVIDEFGSNLDLCRRYARAPRGERAVASLPRNTPPNTTTISSLTTAGMGPSLVTVGGVTTALFEAYVEQSEAIVPK